MIESRTSRGHRTSLVKQVKRLAKRHQYAEAKAFVGSSEFFAACMQMTPYDRIVTMGAVYKLTAPAWKEPPPARSVRAKWGDEQVARLRGIVARYGLRSGLDHELAREMELPLMAVTLARYRYVGRVQAPRPTRKIRVRGFHEPRGPRRPPVHLRA